MHHQRRALWLLLWGVAGRIFCRLHHGICGQCHHSVDKTCFGIVDGAYEGFMGGHGRGCRGRAQFHLHLVVEAGEHVEFVGVGVFCLVDDAEVGLNAQCLAVVGGYLWRAVDDGGAQLKHGGVGESLENSLVTDTVGVAVGDSNADFILFHISVFEK